ncbi:hypothetical protein PI124_g14197 [Phytophthora idaei]|nr:hypothetical protein PI125_g20027 [Phytophthora idaei]KAG3139909.1 hypothetical protein PI126_g16244 [Phytophthora idaei]KAG3240922.1 hypothetical protein PI124_g14197 [Phytophthora idaei]
MSEETPTTTRFWAQTECWRISSSPPASGLLVEVHASGECQRALQHLEKDVINEDRERSPDARFIYSVTTIRAH